MTQVITYYLEQTDPKQIKEKPPVEHFKVIEAEIKQYQYNRFFYQSVGAEWDWKDKLQWSDIEWKDYAEKEELHLYVGYYKGSPAGYFELEKQEEGNVEISYFGLMPAFIGKGLGGYLLTKALVNAWSFKDTQRVWVHTCSLDHPGALSNYRARGMRVYQEVSE
ncbi:GNAT family N-acetyltransferase [Hahella ganghwensis]|uniref:GNAT family N-acetyltransferase n=1 Tax=Hahella ganghwensis TaxID=286420 RepID=UPI000363A95B|nr:GNAT family N-acetyltransferase [Hahella ganghwensis]